MIALRASALTYLTLLSLVPLLAVIYSVIDLVSGHAPFHEGVQKYVNDQLGIGAGAAISVTLTEFTSKATVKTLGAIGFAVLLFSSLSLLWNIESAFNHIYAVKQARSPVQRLLKYWAFLTLGPVLLSTSIWVTWKIGQMQEAHGHGHAGHSEILHVLAALSMFQRSESEEKSRTANPIAPSVFTVALLVNSVRVTEMAAPAPIPS
ncbi:MAG: YihY family inner membrane protein [Deltaproteobacteria bacterium]|nr:MAG: YihY family inner membrane protein [Deltaproteobacteria bacterium]